MPRKTMANVTDLPDEVLCYIFGYLPEEEVFWNVGFTCSYLQDIVINFIKKIRLELVSKSTVKYTSQHGAEFALNRNTPANWENNFHQNIRKVFGYKRIRGRINYVVLGKVYGSLYEEQIVEEIETSNAKFCCRVQVTVYLPRLLYKNYILGSNNVLTK